MPNTNSLYTRIRDEFVTVQSHIDNDSPEHTSITPLTQQLQSLEALELQNTIIRPQNELTTLRPSSQQSTKHKPNVLRSPRPFNQANVITQSKKFRTIKCWGCGQGHSLRDCPTTSDAEKQKNYQQKREASTNNRSTPTNRAKIARTNTDTARSQHLLEGSQSTQEGHKQMMNIIEYYQKL
jgi:hypothetical protein